MEISPVQEERVTAVKHTWFTERCFQNPLNYLKVLLLYSETGGKVLLKVFDWLYKGKPPPEVYLVELANEKKNCIQFQEKLMLQKIKNNELPLAKADFSLLYHLVKICCGLTEYGHDVWSKKCPPDLDESIERKLYLMKEGRNEIAHASSKMFSISDEEVKIREQFLTNLYVSVIKKAGFIINASNKQIEVVCELILFDIRKITEGAPSEEQNIEALIKQDVEFSSKMEYPQYKNVLVPEPQKSPMPETKPTEEPRLSKRSDIPMPPSKDNISKFKKMNYDSKSAYTDKAQGGCGNIGMDGGIFSRLHNGSININDKSMSTTSSAYLDCWKALQTIKNEVE